MQTRRLLLGMSVGLAVVLLPVLHVVQAQNQAPEALTGRVTSEAEGAMEGVVVSAKKAGSTVTVSVVSDAQGRYSFPANRLSAGKYSLKIRAIGYDLVDAATANVAEEQTTTVDLKLRKTKKLVAQMSNAEWMMSLPGTEDQKAFLLNCVGCHTLERIVRSTHDADEWTQVMARMSGYGPVSQPIKPQRMLDPARAGNPEQYRKQAEYLASINLSAASTVRISAQDPGSSHRPGDPRHHHRIRYAAADHRAARRHRRCAGHGLVFGFRRALHLQVRSEDAQAHRISDQGVQAGCPGRATSRSSSTSSGTLWFDTMFQGSLGNLDPKTGEIKYYPLAPEYNDVRVQLNFVGLRHDVDGKVWTKSVGTQEVFRLDLASEKWERFQPLKALGGERHSIYQVISDSQNNLWMAEFTKGHIGKIDAKTGEVTWHILPTHQCAGAADAHRRPGSHLGHRVSRQQGRDVRYQDGEGTE